MYRVCINAICSLLDRYKEAAFAAKFGVGESWGLVMSNVQSLGMKKIPLPALLLFCLMHLHFIEDECGTALLSPMPL